MDFLKQAAGFASQNRKSEETNDTPSEGGYDVNNVSDLLSKTDGFLSDTKPEPVAPEPVKEDEEEDIVKKPSRYEDEVSEPPVVPEDTEEQELEKPPTTELSSADPVKDDFSDVSDVPTTKTTTSSVPTVPTDADGQPSYSELYGSAQTLYSGLRGKMGGNTDVDDQKLAEAAEDLVQGAETYGLVKPDNPYNDYFKKAETFLHGYSSSDSAPTKPPSDESA